MSRVAPKCAVCGFAIYGPLRAVPLCYDCYCANVRKVEPYKGEVPKPPRLDLEAPKED